jgi:hypothetical protein
LVNRKPYFWIGLFALVGLIGSDVTSADAAVKRSTLKRHIYSAQRSRARRAKLAIARVRAMAREMADTVLPR